MRLFTTTLVLITITILFINILNNTDKIEQLEQKLEYKQFQVDSLQHVNDSLVEQYQLFDYIVKPVNYMINLMDAIMEVESSNNDSAYNASEDAVGCLQIRKCMVDDVNRILKRKRITYIHIMIDGQEISQCRCLIFIVNIIG